jgi:hypothetical protein
VVADAFPIRCLLHILSSVSVRSRDNSSPLSIGQRGTGTPERLQGGDLSIGPRERPRPIPGDVKLENDDVSEGSSGIGWRDEDAGMRTNLDRVS